MVRYLVVATKLAGLLLVGCLGWLLGLAAASRGLDHATEANLIPLSELIRALDEVSLVRYHTMMVTSTAGSQSDEEHIRRIATLDQGILQRVAVERSTVETAEEQAHLDAFARAWSGYVAVRDRAITLKRAGMAQAAHELAMREAYIQHQEVRAALVRLMSDQIDSVQELQVKLDAQRSLAQRLSTWIASSVVAVWALIGLTVTGFIVAAAVILRD
jgi:hypothetical protein